MPPIFCFAWCILLVKYICFLCDVAFVVLLKGNLTPPRLFHVKFCKKTCFEIFCEFRCTEVHLIHKISVLRLFPKIFLRNSVWFCIPTLSAPQQKNTLSGVFVVVRIKGFEPPRSRITWPSTMRVCQFRHIRIFLLHISRLFGQSLWLSLVNRV